MQERRKNKRLDLNVNLEIERLDEGEGITTLKLVEVQVKDLSKTGIGFTTKYPLKTRTYYNARLVIWTKEVISCVIEVVRGVKKDDIYEYGGVFVGMTEADALKIEIYQLFNEAENNQ
ncbi:MAG: PilZ domain-containing protein [Eubacterium sp.]|nr:PilZ domain-containing protein [Eubacterium sp.]